MHEVIERNISAVDVKRITLKIPDGMLTIEADQERLERVVLNLLSNALKYSPSEKSVEIEVQLNAGGLQVAVRDQGEGIASEHLPRLFQRFARVQGTSGTEGIGLGLYISRVLVEAHGGKIWAESEPGKGSTFCFTLPMVAH
jgi:signal transduction histidine kinase